MADPTMIPLEFERIPEAVMRQRAEELLRQASRRRSVRQFSTEPVPRDVVERAVRIASSAPSGANLQPWTWVVVGDPDIKAAIRSAAEAEERAFYEERAPDEWLDALAHLGTDAVKTHLTDAPWVAVLFRHRYEVDDAGRRRRNYYSKESVGISAGFFILALHQMGLATLPHTPSPMGFLREALDRPEHEEAELVLPIGYPDPAATVPDIQRRPIGDVLIWR